MKNALLLHGTGASSKGNWFPWLKGKLEEQGWKVWVPDLPQAEKPNVGRYTEFLLSSRWEFSNESLIVGHSSGAVEIFGLLEALPQGVSVGTAILVDAFKDDLGRDDLKGLFKKPFDFQKIRSRAKKFIFLHSDDDPFCPLPGAEFLSLQVGGNLLLVHGQKHFSIGAGGEKYREFPFLLELIEKL